MDEVDYWLKGAKKQNFGDFLSEYFFGRLFIPLPTRFHRVHVIGSVIDDHYISLAKRHRDPSGVKGDLVSFWGCGLRENSQLSPEIKSASNFSAVRGLLTRDLLDLPKETPIGDPGLLLPFIFPAPNESNNLNILVPHISDSRSDDELIKLTGCDQVLRPEVENSPGSLEDFLNLLLKAKFVLCGSLHAAIVRLAYGLPFGYWDSGSIDIPFKWHDFSSSVGIDTRFHKSMQGAHEYWINSLRNNIEFPSLLMLLLVSPYPIFPSVLFKAFEFDRGHGIDFSTNFDGGFIDYWNREASFYSTLINRTKKSLALLDSANERANRAETQASQLRLELDAVLNSRSWKLTKPIRLAGKFARWFIPRAKAWLTLAPGSRPRRVARKTFLWTIDIIRANPVLKEFALKWLNKFPRLKQWLRKMIFSTASTSTFCSIQNNMLGANMADLPPHARQMYTDIKVAIEKQNHEGV